MRSEFAAALLSIAETDERILVISGDLGYAALEDVQSALGHRFINAGIAEQNMMSVAAGLASKGFIPVVYSIAPFAVLRPFEQIRNDICFHKLPVLIVGNGGGYGYGIMGATHHALEDLGLMRLLPGMTSYVPIFQGDVQGALHAALHSNGPAYLRLGKALPNKQYPNWGAWRQIMQGSSLTMVGIGPVIEDMLSIASEEHKALIDVWAVGELPFHTLPNEFVNSVRHTRRVMVIEEHYAAGGLAEALSRELIGIDSGIKFESLAALGYPSGRYGNQKWHQRESGLSGSLLRQSLEKLLCDV